MAKQKKSRLEEIRNIRLEKVETLREMGIDPYPAKSKKEYENKEIVDNYSKYEGKTVTLAGRLMSFREHGNIAFGDIQDESGQIQLFIQKKKLTDTSKEKQTIGFKDAMKLLDIGDFIQATGEVEKTVRGEISLLPTQIKLLSKSIRPLPSTWHGLKDMELRHRKRYLDLLMNERVRDAFRVRSRILYTVREFLEKKDFLEVEVPILQNIAGGANAKPFVTHLEALHEDYYLRIAPELYLKRLLVGGYEKVYDFGKNFRNEGFSHKHNPEYTLLELYQAYGDYETVLNLAEELITYTAKKILGNLEFHFDDNKVSLERPWPRIRMKDIILEKTGVDIDKASVDELKDYVTQEGIKMDKAEDRGTLIDKIFSDKVEPDLIQPVFITDLPADLSPLAKKDKKNPEYVQRFELYMGGFEVANAYSELNDPVDQKERFLEQAKKKAKGIEETHPIDDDYIEALEYGMPPAGGIGFGIDRLVLFFANLPNIREVILFPTLKPEKKAKIKTKKKNKKASGGTISEPVKDQE